MVPRIEYDNPFAVGRPEGIARVDKPRQEERKRRNGNHLRREFVKKEHESESEVSQKDDLGKRIDLEA